MMMLFPHGPMGPWGLLFAVLGGLAWLAVLAGVVLLVIWAVRAMSAGGPMRAAPIQAQTPMDTLAHRFARGEITAEEYEHARDVLRGDPAKP
jgi:putative membrane protein